MRSLYEMLDAECSHPDDPNPILELEGTTLATVLCVEALKGRTKKDRWWRAGDLAGSGAVGSIKVRDSVVSAKVSGTATYRVSLRVQEESLVGTCTCPDGPDEEARGMAFCKHISAVGLVVLGWGEQRVPSSIVPGLDTTQLGEEELRDVARWLVSDSGYVGAIARGRVRISLLIKGKMSGADVVAGLLDDVSKGRVGRFDRWEVSGLLGDIASTLDEMEGLEKFRALGLVACIAAESHISELGHKSEGPYQEIAALRTVCAALGDSDLYEVGQSLCEGVLGLTGWIDFGGCDDDARDLLNGIGVEGRRGLRDAMKSILDTPAIVTPLAVGAAQAYERAKEWQERRSEMATMWVGLLDEASSLLL